jgi:hypothetical protein
MRKTLIIAALAIVMVSTMFAMSEAKNSYLNAVNTTCGTSYSCGLCHIDTGGGGPLTTGGQGYVASGYSSCYFCPSSSSCSTPTCTDNDADTYSIESTCGAVDCNDNNSAVNPGAAEACTNAIDDDCDGNVDCADSNCSTNPACVVCTDNDADTYYVESTCGTAVDCNDGSAAVNPGAAEVCNNSGDDDCDGKIDCADSNCSGDPACAGVCVPTSTTERKCTDGIDNDCDGLLDCADSDCSKNRACK